MTNDQTLPFRMRPDLAVQTARYEGRMFYLIKDAVRLKYFRLQAEEFAILQLLDGKRSLAEIQRTFQDEFRPRAVSLQDLLQYIARLEQTGLLLNETTGQGVALLDRARQQQKQRVMSGLTNLLYIKLPGADPERFLKWLHPKVRWLFSPISVAGAMLLVLAALALIVVNFDEFRGKPELSQFHAFFNVYNIVWLWLALAVAKIIHELGHGLTCTHFGGECHEMGLLFLVFSPCLYANVSDAWMLPNKWHRIAISAAGIYVEVVLAAIATFAWWYSEPGLVHNLAFSMLFVCSVSTIVFNANPLMRFDGYYVLSDLLEIPNLRAKASRLMQQCFGRWCLGIDPPRDTSMPESRRWLFVSYAVSACVYRWVITCGILLFLYTFLKPYKLAVLSAGLALAVVVMLIVLPIWRLGRFVMLSRRSNAMSNLRLSISSLVVLALILSTLFISLPHRVRTVLTVEARAAEAVFVSVPGTLQAIHVEPGQKIDAGQPLIELRSAELSMQHIKLQREIAVQEVAEETYESLDLRGRMSQARQARIDAQQQLAERERQQAKLFVRAPTGGIILPPPETTSQTLHDDDQLSDWSGIPLDPENLGTQLPFGTPVCQVGNPDDMQAVLVIDQSDVEFVRTGQTVWMKFDAFPEKTFQGTIEEIAAKEADSAPRQLSTQMGGELPTKIDGAGNERPFHSSYLARVRLQTGEKLLPGFRGRAKIECGRRTGAQWLNRSLAELFRFRL